MTELIRRLKSSAWFAKLDFNVMLVILLSLLMIFLSISSAQAQTGLACDNRIQISLDQNCEALITPDVLVEESNIDESLYTVHILNSSGNVIAGNPLLTGTHVGNSYQVKIIRSSDSSTCWGYIDVEEKHPPQFENCRNDTMRISPISNIVDTLKLACTELDSLTRLPEPITIDQCSSGDTIITYTDVYSDQPCFADGYVDMITRTWKATDNNGNMSTCLQIIAIEKPDFNTIMWPPHYNGDTINGHRLELSCDYMLDTLDNIVKVDTFIRLDSGLPSPESTGYPSGIECRNIQYTYRDIELNQCGNGVKLLREWTLLDWCTSETRKYPQIIKIIDDRAPIVICSDSITVIQSDPWQCMGTLDTVPPPFLIHDCSNTSYTIAYKKKDGSGDPFTDTETTNVRTNSDGSFSIIDLPLDTTWIIYTITDDCGHSAQCYAEVVVRDMDPPNAICQAHTIVSLDHIGKAKVAASVFNDHSYDNCGIVYLQAKRYGETFFRDSVEFTCADISPIPIEIVMRAYDAAGNYGDCLVSIKVQNKLVNVLYACPGDVTINCDQSTHADSIGRPLLDESCITADVSYIDEELSDFKCGEGTIQRIWTIVDAQGFIQECIQYIHVTDLDPFTEYDIIWPEHMDVDGCSHSDTDPDYTGRPKFLNEDCVSLTVGYQDEEFKIQGACLKIVREWSVIDWCRYDANFPDHRAKWHYYQNIKLNNDIAPQFIDGCEDIEIVAGDNCTAVVTLSARATDDCTESTELDYEYTLDTDYTGSFTIQDKGYEGSFEVELGIGTHAVEWMVTDECGKTNTCFRLIKVVDGSVPVPICLGALSLSLTSEGWIEIWASDFIKEISGGCGYTDQDGYSFSFSENADEPNRKIDCAHFYDYEIGKGVSYVEELQVYLRKGDQTFDYCEVVLRVTDNFNLCPDFEAPSATVSGLVTTEDMEPLSNFEVMISNMETNIEEMSMTSDLGAYSFPSVALYHDYSISPIVEEDAANGVSTLDLVLIQQHILGLRSLDSPYKLIAADINNSGSISAIDLIQLRRLILGQDESFSEVNSWEFVDRSFDLVANDPLGTLVEKHTLENIIENQSQLDFIGIKMGDVNGSVVVNAQQTEVRSASTFDLLIKNKEFNASEFVEVSVLASEDVAVKGFQMALEIDEELLGLERVEGTNIEINESNYNLDRGILTISWNKESEINLSRDQALFTLVFKTKTKTHIFDAISLSENSLETELIHADLRVSKLGLSFLDLPAADHQFKLFQNTPNPFLNHTKIAFHLPESDKAIISIFDINGKLLHRVEDNYKKGYNELNLQLTQFQSSGVLYLNVVSGENTATMKMIQMK